MKVEKEVVGVGPRVTTFVVDREKSKRRKRKYSSGVRPIAEIERGVSRVLDRLATAVEEGIYEWRKGSDRSARRKRDGALRDAPQNLAMAVSRTIRVASRAPVDAAKVIPKLRLRKVSRRLVSTILG